MPSVRPRGTTKHLSKRYPEVEKLPSPAHKLVFRSYIQGADRLGRDFALTAEQFVALLSSPCAYCGDPGGNTLKISEEPLRYNGIDRVDNARGYTHENSVACCKTCNSMKGDRTAAEFKEHCTRVATK
jgi:hypothetical protein